MMYLYHSALALPCLARSSWCRVPRWFVGLFKQSIGYLVCLGGFQASLSLYAPAALAQASTVGQWGTTQPFPYVSVHASLLPTGQVLFWDYSGNARLWDPASTAITTPAQPGRNTFCSGQSYLADGKLFVVGGHIQNNV